MISNYTREQKKPQFQQRGYQSDPYLPALPVEDKYCELGGPAQMLIRAAYMTPMMSPGWKGRGLTGVNPVKPFISKSSRLDVGGTKVSAFNNSGNMSGAVVLNSQDKAQEDVLYGGMHVSFQYKWNWSHGLPRIDGRVFQVCSHRPYYENLDGKNKGGDVAIVLNFTTLVRPIKKISMVVRLYALNDSQSFYERINRFDPNNGKLHTSNYLGCVNNRYITAAPESDGSKHSRGHKLFTANDKTFNNMFKFKLSDEKLHNLLLDAAAPEFFGEMVPVHLWRLEAAVMQYELNETGQAIVGGAFSGFKVS